MMPPAPLTSLAQSVKAELGKHRGAKSTAGRVNPTDPLPTLGLTDAELEKITHAAFSSNPISMAAEWRRAITELWQYANYREEWHAAIQLASYEPYQRFISLALLPLYRKMVQEGAATDVVDPLAQRVGVLLATYPDRIKPTLRAWARHENIWLRRVAILAQLGFGDKTDLMLLFDSIEPSRGTKDPSIRKALGTALKDAASAFPEEIKAFLATHPDLPPAVIRDAEKGMARPAAKAKKSKNGRK